MGDIVGIATSIINGVVYSSGAIIRIISAVFNFNYRLVTTLVKIAFEGTKALRSVVVILWTATEEICFYLADLCVEGYLCLNVILQYIGQLGILILQHSYIWCEKLANFIGWMASQTEVLLSVISVSIVDLTVFLYSFVWNEISKTSHFAKESISHLGAVSLNATKLASESISDTTYHFQKKIAVTAGHLQTSLSSLLYNATVCALNMSMTCGYRLGHSVSNSGQKFYDQGSTYVFQLAKSAPYDLYFLGIVLCSLVLTAKFLLDYLHKHGFTFPLVLSSRNEFDEEYEVDESSDEEEGVEDLNETIIDESDDEESEEEDSSEDESEEETDEEGDENNINIINVQLPQRGDGYMLRTRTTPAVAFPNKLTSGELERVLENERDKRLCVVCQDQVKCVLVLPCKHMCLCVDCAHEIVSARVYNRRVCPLCRAHIHTVMNVYV